MPAPISAVVRCLSRRRSSARSPFVAQLSRDPIRCRHGTTARRKNRSPISSPARKAGLWSFDTEAGRREVLFRRVGHNEISTIQTCPATPA
jgi:hypothetical protein